MWLRTDTVDGTPVTVFAAPAERQAAGRYDERSPPTPRRCGCGWTPPPCCGGPRSGSGRDWVTVDFPDAPAPALEPCRRPSGWMLPEGNPR